MSISSHRLSNINYDEDVVHSVILDKTPSPPPKPPRGILRKGPPMKPQRSALKIDPSQNDDKENCTQPQPRSQFKAKDTMEQMQSYFKRSIAVLRRTEEFTGTEAADILTAYIESHRNDFPRENVGRSNAIKLLSLWLESKIIQGVESNQKKFVDNERSFYRLGGESERHNSAECDLTPIRFTVARESVRTKSSKDKSELSETDAALVQMMNGVIDDKKVTLSDKRKKLMNFQKHYPALYKQYFDGML
ncbi:hypothetical protein CAEBREN_28178 [Caenorhabditis brenneri]|uniref:DEP domain-containing protein n=1 Tax=Caenorhabditis brenneri TaxID=135651 RepID=G0PI83_CAEBE|nr:hypothetical protein CAEBREN_28178 [Caenorhabditis brenneri]